MEDRVVRGVNLVSAVDVAHAQESRDSLLDKLTLMRRSVRAQYLQDVYNDSSVVLFINLQQLRRNLFITIIVPCLRSGNTYRMAFETHVQVQL